MGCAELNYLDLHNKYIFPKGTKFTNEFFVQWRLGSSVCFYTVPYLPSQKGVYDALRVLEFIYLLVPPCGY